MLKKRRVLIVEDEEVQVMSLELLLQAWGHETCESATSAAEALERMERESPDVVLMDINIQGEMGGIEAAGIIIERFSVQVILMTGYDDDALYAKAQTIKPAGYLVKPFELADLQNAIESLP